MAVMIRIPKNLSTIFLFLVNKLRNAEHFFKKIKTVLNQELLEKHCLLCDESTANTMHFCSACIEDLPSIPYYCKTCALPITLSEQVDRQTLNIEPSIMCGECISRTPSFSETLCPFKYEFPIRQIIRQIKYENKRYWIKPLCHFLEGKITLAIKTRENFAYPDLLIPIPIHKSKLKTRGFNQAELIAKTISNLTKIPFDKSILIKIKNTANQSQLDKQERMKNLKGSLQVSSKAIHKFLLTGKHIVLIDDVMTTKATAEYASKLLLEAGAKKVDVWCIARTPKQKTV